MFNYITIQRIVLLIFFINVLLYEIYISNHDANTDSRVPLKLEPTLLKAIPQSKPKIPTIQEYEVIGSISSADDNNAIHAGNSSVHSLMTENIPQNNSVAVPESLAIKSLRVAIEPVKLKSVTRVSRKPIVAYTAPNRTSFFNQPLYLDWNHEAELFTYMHYKALERLIVLYDCFHEAKSSSESKSLTKLQSSNSQYVDYQLRNMVQLSLIAPNAANYYQWSGHISKHMFQKYNKVVGTNVFVSVLSESPIPVPRGVNASSIAMSLYNTHIKDNKWTLFKGGRYSRGSYLLEGVMYEYPPATFDKKMVSVDGGSHVWQSDYWLKQFQDCCVVMNAHDIRTNSNVNKALPFHYVLYNRLMLLYYPAKNNRNTGFPGIGGLFADFTVYQVHPVLVVDHNGNWKPNPAIYADPNNSTDSDTFIRHHRRLHCNSQSENLIYFRSFTNSFDHPTTLLYFKHSYDPVLYCMLHAYDHMTSVFQNCLNHSENVTSSESELDGSLDSDSAQMMCIVELANRCVNRYADVSRTCFVSEMNSWGWNEQQHATEEFPISGANHSGFAKALTNHQQPDQFPLIWFDRHDRRFNAADNRMNSNTWKLDENSLLYEPIQLNNLQFVTKLNENRWPHGSNFPQLPCSPYYIPMKTNQWSDADRAQAMSSCAPTFIMPGFMKSGTTFVYDVLTKHPQVIKAMRGVVFKETGCYLEQNSVATPDRMKCFPFVEPNSVCNTVNISCKDSIGSGAYVKATTSYAFGDGTVTYALRKHIPGNIRKDNPHMRILFSIRDPISRFLSHHKFVMGDDINVFTRTKTTTKSTWKSGLGPIDYRDTNNVVEKILGNSTDNLMWQFHGCARMVLESISNGESLATSPIDFKDNPYMVDLIDMYFAGARAGFKTKSKPLHGTKGCPMPTATLPHASYFKGIHMLINSVYVAPIAHWMNVFNPKGSMLEHPEATLSNIDNQVLVVNVKRLSPVISNNTEARGSEAAALVNRWNRIYHFLGIHPTERVAVGDAHTTANAFRGQSLVRNDGLSEENTALLKEFFLPFDAILNRILSAQNNHPYKHAHII